jgi:hypothetical protein
MSGGNFRKNKLNRDNYPKAQNMEFTLLNHTILFQVDLSKTWGPSKSGDSEIIISTGGADAPVPGRPDLRMRVFIYKPYGPGEKPSEQKAEGE